MAPTDFALEWEHEQATCPQGEHSLRWKQGQEGNRSIIKIHFATATCRQCPVREHCTHSWRGRSLTILPKLAQQAREERLAEQFTPPFRAALCPTSRRRSHHLATRFGPWVVVSV